MTALLGALTIVGVIGGWAGLYFARREREEAQQRRRDGASRKVDVREPSTRSSRRRPARAG